MIRSILSSELREATAEFVVKRVPGSALSVLARYADFPVKKVVLNAGVLFIHVPKNGGTTVSTQLYGGHVGHRSAQYYLEFSRSWFYSVKSFALLREPIDRFISSYYYLKQGGSHKVPASDSAVKFIANYSSPNELAEHLSGFSLEDLRVLDPVLRDQSFYFCDPQGKVLVDLLFSLEKVRGHTFQVADRVIDMTRRTNVSRKLPNSVSQMDIKHLTKSLEKLYALDIEKYRVLDAR